MVLVDKHGDRCVTCAVRWRDLAQKLLAFRFVSPILKPKSTPVTKRDNEPVLVPYFDLLFL